MEYFVKAWFGGKKSPNVNIMAEAYRIPGAGAIIPQELISKLEALDVNEGFARLAQPPQCDPPMSGPPTPGQAGERWSAPPFSNIASFQIRGGETKIKEWVLAARDEGHVLSFAFIGFGKPEDRQDADVDKKPEAGGPAPFLQEVKLIAQAVYSSVSGSSIQVYWNAMAFADHGFSAAQCFVGDGPDTMTEFDKRWKKAL